MTLPLTTGFPDFGREFDESRVNEVQDVNVTKLTAFTYPVRYMGNAKALICWFSPQTVDCQVQFLFYQDAGGTILIDTYPIDVQTGGTAREPVPILGPYMAVKVLPSVGGSFNYTLLVSRIPSLQKFAGGSLGLGLISVTSRSVAAGATDIVFAPIVESGPAIWSFVTTASAFQVTIRCQSYLATLTNLDFMDNGRTNTWTPRAIYLPPMVISSAFVNFDASAKTYNLYLTQGKRNS